MIDYSHDPDPIDDPFKKSLTFYFNIDIWFISFSTYGNRFHMVKPRRTAPRIKPFDRNGTADPHTLLPHGRSCEPDG